MKPTWFALLFTSLALFLSACEITITGVDASPPISNASFETNYQATVDGVQAFIICEDKTTLLSYEFDYSGNLISWESYLRGVTNGTIRGRTRLSLSDQRVETLGNSRVRATYEIPPNTAPLSVGPVAQSIVVVPNDPEIVGYSRLLLEVDGYTESIQLSSNPVPVVRGCP